MLWRNPRKVPLISVAMCAYNHEAYIGEAIDSIRDQTVDDWELIIVNDGSTDRTAKRIRSYKDPRITFLDQQNQGPGTAFNRAIAGCRGKYVAFMSGDDRSYPNRLEQQVEAYEAGSRRVLFGWVDFIDSAGRTFTPSDSVLAVFEKQQLTRGQILERFFTRGNFLNAVTAFSERKVFVEAGPYDPTLYQLQDFEMWIRLVKKYELCVLPQKSLQYRIHPANLSNISDDASNRGQRARTITEQYLIMRDFFEDTPKQLFHEAFDHLLIYPGCETDLERECEQAFLFVRSPFKLNKLIGVEKLRLLLRRPQSEGLLKRRYGFTPTSFADLLKNVDVTNGQF